MSERDRNLLACLGLVLLTVGALLAVWGIGWLARTEVVPATVTRTRTALAPSRTVTSSPTPTWSPTGTATARPSSTPTATSRPSATSTPTPTATARPSATSVPTATETVEVLLPVTGGEQPADLGILGYLAEQLPVAVLLLVGGYFVARYAAGLMEKLLGNQTQLQGQLVDVIDRNTTAWSEATVAMANLAAIQAGEASQVEQVRKDLRGIRVLLATKPCVAEEAVEADEE